MNASVECPVCGGPIGTHLVRRGFKCHHCEWMLTSNAGIAFLRGAIAGLFAGLASFAFALLLPYPAADAILAWMPFGAVVGLAFGAAAYYAALVLTPLRPPRREVRIIEENEFQESTVNAGL